ncbi:MAG: Mur ligase family protein [bacterium]
MLYLIYLIFIWQRLRRWLNFYQQHEYDSKRFLSWWIKNKHFDKRATIALIILFLINLINSWVSLFFGIILFAILAFLEPRTKSFKKPLVFTARAKRIFALSLIIIIGVSIWLKSILFLILIIQALPIFAVFANLILWPFEKIIQEYYKRDAQKILKKYQPIVIGITGSYAKTTTKYILGQILNAYQPTLWTPGSINTLMGITKVIRQDLRPEHKYLIVEMGAYKIGSIKKLCEFVKPKHGIITSIGIAHYERFKSIKNIKKAKHELFESLPQDGIAIKGKDSAIIMAKKLGVPDLTIQAALKHAQLPPHRLEIKKINNIIIIDDSYNSNPIGFKKVLLLLKKQKGKKILITPGMAELGAKSEQEHQKIAKLIAKVCDYVILVNKNNSKCLQKYLENYYLFSTLKQAQEFVNNLAKPGDAILYENDLPDIYDDKIIF